MSKKTIDDVRAVWGDPTAVSVYHEVRVEPWGVRVLDDGLYRYFDGLEEDDAIRAAYETGVARKGSEAPASARVPVSEYPGWDDFAWVVEGEGGHVEQLDVLVERFVENDPFGGTLARLPFNVVTRLRPPSPDDILFDAREVYNGFRNHLERRNEEEPVNWEMGGPHMPSWDEVPSHARASLVAALRTVVASAIDLSEAGWLPTGEVVRVYPDGTVERVDDGGGNGA